MKRIIWFVLGVIVGVLFAREIMFWKDKAVRYLQHQYEHVKNLS